MEQPYPQGCTARELQLMKLPPRTVMPLRSQPGVSLTPFRAWLESQDPDRSAGYPTSVYDCTLARFLIDRGAPLPAVWDMAFTPNMRQEGFLPLPAWARRFVAAEVSRRHNWITVMECRLILAGERYPIETRVPDGGRPGFVYLIRAENGLYKIGKATDPRARFTNISLMSPVELQLLHTISVFNAFGVESALHKRFAHRRVRGEWFELDNQDVTFLMSITQWTREGAE